MLGRLTSRRRPVTDVSEYDLYLNPYPWYRRLRETLPVVHAPALRHYAGGTDTYWLVTRWDDVVHVLKDDETFASPPEVPDLPAGFRGALPHLDGARHAEVRASMQPLCSPRRANAFAEETVRRRADHLLDRLEKLGEADLIDAYFEPLAALTIADLLGLVDIPVDRLRTWFDHLGCYFIGDLLPRNAELDREIDEVLLERFRRTNGGQDASLLAAMKGAPLEEDEVLGNAKFFAAAGVHELSDLVAHTLVGLLGNSEQLSAARADGSLAKNALEEGARWSSPVGMVPRRTAAATELGGVRIPRGAYVAAVIASANRDDVRWTDGATFDLHRDEGMHLAYASGEHFCLGAWVARAAGMVALQRLLERLPNIRLKRDDTLMVTGWRFRDVRRLPVTWT
jgi:cytochrome P450